MTKSNILMTVAALVLSAGFANANDAAECDINGMKVAGLTADQCATAQKGEKVEGLADDVAKKVEEAHAAKK